MASKPARHLLASIACCAPLLLAGGREGVARADGGADAAPAATAAARPTATAPAAQERPGPGERPPFRPGAERFRQLQQDRAQQDRAQPGRRGPSHSQPGPGVLGWPFEHPGKGGGGSLPDEDEWRQTTEMISEISPARWQFFEQVMGRPQRAERAKRFLFARSSELRELQKTNPNLFEARVEQVRLEDEIFRLDTAVREAGANSAGEADQLRAQLRERVADWVRKDLAERELRLTQLQERLDRERAALDADRDRADEIAERRTEVIRRASERFRAWAGGGKPARENATPGSSLRPAPPATGPDLHSSPASPAAAPPEN
jgi:hypothetical protein